MGTGIFGIGVSGMAAAQMGLLTTGHNISNAGTAGFHRQEIVQRAALPQVSGAGYIGNGVEVSTVRRMYDQFLGAQVVQAQTDSSRLDTFHAQLKQLDDMLGDSTAGLAPALEQFFTATHDVAANPASVPSRQAMLSAASALVSRFHALDQRYGEIRAGVNTEIVSSVGEINSFADQIASLNRQILVAQSAGQGQPPNDLLDQRDELVLQLNKQIGATVVKQSDGNYNVFIGNGQALVVGGSALKLTAAPLPDDPGRMGIAYRQGGATAWIREDSLQGGALSGYLDFRSQMLDDAQSSLGRIALGLAQTFNDQHQLGQDLQNQLGGRFFSVPAPTVLGNAANSAGATVTAAIVDVGAVTTGDYHLTYDGTTYTLARLSDGTTATSTNPAVTPLVLDGLRITGPAMVSGDSFLIQPARNGASEIGVLVTDTAKIAAAAPIATAAASANTGTAKISAGSVNPGGNADPNLRQNVRIEFTSATQYRIVDAATSAVLQPATAYASGQDIVFNGWTVKVNGAWNAGDTFTVGPNTNGNADNRNALALGALSTANVLAGGTASFNAAYGQLVSAVGNKTRELEVTSGAQANLLTQTSQAQEALGGVNLDEEAANLLRYQQAYQASGKVLQIATKLFDTVLSIGT